VSDVLVAYGAGRVNDGEATVHLHIGNPAVDVPVAACRSSCRLYDAWAPPTRVGGVITCRTCLRIADGILDTSSERATEGRIARWLKDRPDVWCLKVHGSQFQRAGVADRILCVRGMFAAVEVKSRTTKPTPLQERELERVRRAGGTAVVVRSLNEFQAVVLQMEKFQILGL
jgi:hypothetical protein